MCEEQRKESSVVCVGQRTQRHGVVVQRVPAIIDRSARVLPLALRRGRGGSHRESRERAPVAQKQPTRGDVRRAERRESGCVSKAFFFFFFSSLDFCRRVRNSCLEIHFWNFGIAESQPLVWTTTSRVLRPFWTNVSRTRGVVCASKKSLPLFFSLLNKKWPSGGDVVVVTWDLALEFAACETSRERESKISARGARKGGKRQRTETQRATVSTRRVRRLFSVLDDFVGRAAKRSCSTRVVFLSFSCTYTSFFFVRSAPRAQA